MRRATAALVLLALSAPLPARAEPGDVKDIPPGPDVIVSVRAGQAAPFSGQLYDPKTALRWANWIDQLRALRAADAELADERRAAEVDLCKQTAQIADEKYKVVVASYRARDAALTQENARLKDTPWYRSPWFGFAVGIFVTGAAVGAGVALTR